MLRFCRLKPTIVVPAIILIVSVQITLQLCTDIDDVTVCVGAQFKIGHPLNITTTRRRLCFLHGENSVIPPGVFALLPRNIETLYLNNTNVIEIRRGAFASLPHLKTLGLSGNRIALIADEAFEDCESVQTLDLAGNNIEYVDAINFSGLSGLREIYLVHNLIRAIRQPGHNNDYLSMHLHQLTYMDLSLNYLEALTDSSFNGLSGLVRLNVGFNKIRQIERNAFIGLKSLRELNLEGNDLKDVASLSDLFMGFVGNLVKVSLSVNQFNCSIVSDVPNFRPLHYHHHRIVVYQNASCY